MFYVFIPKSVFRTMLSGVRQERGGGIMAYVLHQYVPVYNGDSRSCPSPTV